MAIYIVLLLVYIGLSFIPANIGRKKGYSMGAFWWLSFLGGFFVALIIAVIINDKVQSYSDSYTEYSPQNNLVYEKCRNCNSKYEEGSIYCPKCGQKTEPEIEEETSDFPNIENLDSTDIQHIDKDTILCLNCNTRQRSGRRICYKCEAKFNT